MGTDKICRHPVTRPAALPPTSPLHPPVPRRAGDRLYWDGLKGSSRSLAIAAAAHEFSGLTLVVVPNASTADAVRGEIEFFSSPGQSGCRFRSSEGNAQVVRHAEPPLLLHLPDWETLPYDVLSPHPDIVSSRLAALNALPGATRGILVVSAPTLMERLAPRSFVEANSLVLGVGERMDLAAARTRLELGGYRCVSQVMEHGEFAVRGSLLDLFPSGAGQPYRIDLFDDEVETIRTFDPESQRSRGRVDSIHLLPAREFPLDPDAIEALSRRVARPLRGQSERVSRLPGCERRLCARRHRVLAAAVLREDRDRLRLSAGVHSGHRACPRPRPGSRLSGPTPANDTSSGATTSSVPCSLPARSSSRRTSSSPTLRRAVESRSAKTGSRTTLPPTATCGREVIADAHADGSSSRRPTRRRSPRTLALTIPSRS